MDRTPENIRHHYEVERELADRLRTADPATRRGLYHQVYNELYTRVTDIPHLAAARAAARDQEVAALVAFLRPFLEGRRCFLELGPGDFKLSLAVSEIVPSVYAADVTDEVVATVSLPPAVRFVLTDGFTFDVPKGSVDVAFSDQVLEHLHPDDAEAQVRAIRELLAPGGIYICITPNRLYGPHDISQYFDSEAKGLHLKEYTVSDVARLFRTCGFSQVQAYTVSGAEAGTRVPLSAASLIEGCLERLPVRLRRGLACSAGFKWVLRSRVVGRK